MHMYVTSALQKTDMKSVFLQMAMDLLHKKVVFQIALAVLMIGGGVSHTFHREVETWSLDWSRGRMQAGPTGTRFGWGCTIILIWHSCNYVTSFYNALLKVFAKIREQKVGKVRIFCGKICQFCLYNTTNFNFCPHDCFSSIAQYWKLLNEVKTCLPDHGFLLWQPNSGQDAEGQVRRVWFHVQVPLATDFMDISQKLHKHSFLFFCRKEVFWVDFGELLHHNELCLIKHLRTLLCITNLIQIQDWHWNSFVLASYARYNTSMWCIWSCSLEYSILESTRFWKRNASFERSFWAKPPCQYSFWLLSNGW